MPIGKKIAFTLAEILITLGVIGIVAALTIPSIVQNYKEKTFVTGTKKIYSILSIAVQQAIIENGSPENWGITLNDSSPILEKILPYIKYAKFCDSALTPCFQASICYYRNGKSGQIEDQPARSSIRLNNGVLISSFAQSSDCSAVFANGKNASNVCGEYVVDINGNKGPNTFGKDYFIFFLTKYGVIPSGSSEFEHIVIQDEDNDRYQNKNYKFDTGCLDKQSQGFGCAGWVVEKGNMDYWRCDDLNWGSKTRCD